MKTILTLAAVILTPYSIQAQNQPSPVVGWYNGDCQSGIPGWANWYSSDRQFARIYDNFVVPKNGWTIAGVFSNNAVAAGVTQASWEIRAGVSNGNAGMLIASGLSPAAATLVATWPDGETIYAIQVNGLSVPLPEGTYWLNVNPVTSVLQTYVCPTLGSNALGNPPGDDSRGFYYSTFLSSLLNEYFVPAKSTGPAGSTGDFSQGVLISGSAAPTISSVVNAANWKSGAVSPGEIVAIEGTALASYAPTNLALDPAGKVATALSGVQVLIGGVAAPLLFVGATQINAVVPYEAEGSANASVQVSYGGQTSAVFPLTVTASAPSIFTASGTGAGPAAALNPDYSYNGPSNAAAKGSYVTLFLTGEGQTYPAGITGKVTTVATSQPATPQPQLAVSATLDGKPAPILFYGEAPGVVSGVMQINLQIPPDTNSGNLPLSISVGSNSTQSGVTISVK